jgi:hypothetical protein
MKKIDDSKLYFYFALVTLTISIVLGIISFYSILVVEKNIVKLLSANEESDKNFKEAYLLLRDPQIFARYQHFDTEQDLQLSISTARRFDLESKESLTKLLGDTYPGTTVMKAIRYFDRKIYTGNRIEPDEKKYLEVLLDRRKKGSRLGRNTMIFTLALSLFSFLFYFYERRTVKD